MQIVKKPIIIVGVGRSGSTIFHDIYSHHPQVTWLSQWCNKRPARPQINRGVMRIMDLPLPSRYIRKLLYPVEPYRFWEYYVPGFTEPCHDLRQEDVTPRIKKIVPEILSRMITSQRNRLLIKITGWPRIGFFKEIFPDAKFIHIYRDGRAVVNSLLNVRWWSGWRGPANWRWGELTNEQKDKWEKFNRSFVVLAAIEWEILMAAQEQAKQTIPPDDLLEIRYEDLCLHPLEIFKKAILFSELEWSRDFEATLGKFPLSNTNHKWQEQLTDAQQKMLNECLSDTLKKYQYE